MDEHGHAVIREFFCIMRLELRSVERNKDLIVFECSYEHEAKRHYNAPLAKRDCKALSEGRKGNLLNHQRQKNFINNSFSKPTSC